MRCNTPILIGFCFLVAVLGSCQTTEGASDTVPTPTLPDPHHHVVDVNQTRLDPQSIADFRIAEVSVEPTLRRENITVNREETFQAFTACDQTSCRIFVEDLDTGQVYKIQGLPLPWRPFSDLVWISNDILVFDRWSQPHYGIHYAVDVREKTLILASPFPDQLPDISGESTEPANADD